MKKNRLVGEIITVESDVVLFSCDYLDKVGVVGVRAFLKKNCIYLVNPNISGIAFAPNVSIPILYIALA